MIFALILIVIAVFTAGCATPENKNAGNTINEDSLKFKEEYEAFNNKISEDGINLNKFLSISEENKVVYLSFEDLLDFIRNGTGLLFFGRPACPWCRLLVPDMLDFARAEDASIYYFNIERDRAENSEQYKTILAMLGEYLPLDDVTQGEYFVGFDPNLKRVPTPSLFFIKEGEVKAYLNMAHHEYLENGQSELVLESLRYNYGLINE